ncbi:MAG: lytic transglycosylase domain-containing protein [Acidobacteriota bacterium]
MKIPHNITRLLSFAALLLLVTCTALAQSQVQVLDQQSETSTEIRLKLKDGSSISVDDAWESEQGIWYRVGAISHLMTRDRVKGIERHSNVKSAASLQTARVFGPNNTDSKSDEQPVWIYLKGGARVEADSATESAAGVWYRRGPFTIFIDRVRIDRIEREDLENVAESDSSSRKERGWTTGNGRIDSLIRQNGARYGIDPYLIFCVMEQESHFNARALSPKGARGLMQLMPGTAARFGVKRPSDPAQNIAGGTRYLKQLMGQFNGRIDLVLASYNAGEGAVLKFGRKVPPYRETRDYVKRISYRYRRARPLERAKNSLPAVPASSL